jgi:hypothetical protein
MLYRGIEYHVSQTSGPRSWKWTVILHGKQTMTGESWGRAAAVLDAEAVIAKAIKKSRKQQGQITESL